MSFDELKKISGKLEDVFAVWGFGGGWAIDGTVGKVTRGHDDIAICVLREDLDEWREVWPDADWFKVVDGRDVPLNEGEEPDASVQTLHVRDGGTVFELVLLETKGEDWIFGNDARVKMPIEEVFVAGVERLPFLNPAIALMMKSAGIRDKDMKDFKAVLPFLSAFEAEWLMLALKVVYGEHIWMTELKEKKTWIISVFWLRFPASGWRVNSMKKCWTCMPFRILRRRSRFFMSAKLKWVW